MREWRDVFSAATFRACRTAWETQRAQASAQRQQQRSLDTLINAVEGRQGRSRAEGINAKAAIAATTSDNVLDEVERELTEYHAVKKTDISKFDERRKRLVLISEAAGHAIKVLGFTQQELTGRADYGADPRDPRTGALMVGDPRRESLPRNLLTLQRRSLRKAAYLTLLEKHSKEHDDSRENLREMFARKREAGKFLELVPGVRLEKHDFMHRPFENHVVDGEAQPGLHVSAIGAAFETWLFSNKSPIPFFVWLENNPVCTGEDKSKAPEIRTVSYEGGDGKRMGRVTKFYVVTYKPTCQMTPVGGGTSVATDTSLFVAAPGKAITTKGAQGLAAFVWAEDKTLFIAEHVEGGFHHSSFMSGGRVRCAGMIRFENGKATEISNNSGHYKPPLDNLQKFVSYLHDRGCLKDDAVVQVCGLGGSNPPVVKAPKGKIKV